MIPLARRLAVIEARLKRLHRSAALLEQWLAAHARELQQLAEAGHLDELQTRLEGEVRQRRTERWWRL